MTRKATDKYEQLFRAIVLYIYIDGFFLKEIFFGFQFSRIFLVSEIVPVSVLYILHESLSKCSYFQV